MRDLLRRVMNLPRMDMVIVFAICLAVAGAVHLVLTLLGGWRFFFSLALAAVVFMVGVGVGLAPGSWLLNRKYDAMAKRAKAKYPDALKR